MRAASRLVLLAALAFAGSSCAGADEKRSEGREVFADAGCAGCHTLADAGASAKVGPDLDRLRPSVSRIVRQVKRGGRGMPAFEHKLSEAEIVAVAQYVDGVAGRGTEQAAAFEPDDTTVEECRRERTPQCWEQALGNLVISQGPERALETLEALDRETPPGFSCHRVTHVMGGAALVRFKGDVANAFIDGSPVCASGYYHGVLERAFAGVEESQLAAKARELCADAELVAAPFLQYQCLHGLGHGLMIYTVYDLKLSLKTCDALQDGFGQTSCSGGVFMENVNTSYGTRSEWLRDDDLIYPCNAVEERHKYQCYGLATARIRQVKPRWEEGADECRRSEPGWVEVCYQSMGRDVSGEAGRDPHRALRSCREAEEYEIECVYGVAREIVNADGGGERAGRFCDLAPRRHRPRCFNGVGSVLAALHPNRADLRRACRRTAQRYQDDCFQGAGLR